MAPSGTARVIDANPDHLKQSKPVDWAAPTNRRILVFNCSFQRRNRVLRGVTSFPRTDDDTLKFIVDLKLENIAPDDGTRLQVHSWTPEKTLLEWPAQIHMPAIRRLVEPLQARREGFRRDSALWFKG